MNRPGQYLCTPVRVYCAVSEPGVVHLTSVTYLQHLLAVGNGEGIYFLLKELCPLFCQSSGYYVWPVCAILSP